MSISILLLCVAVIVLGAVAAKPVGYVVTLLAALELALYVFQAVR